MANADHASGIKVLVRDQWVALEQTGENSYPELAGLLDRVHGYCARFIAYPVSHAAIAHVLWVAHTHAMDAWESTPRLACLSPEPGSGKTRVLEITENLVPRPVEAVNVTAAYLFRKVADDDGRPTILHDEIDTIFGPKANNNEELRGLLNAGHRQGAVAGRCVVRGKLIETEEIPAYCAVALAGLDDLPDTIRSRSIIIRMRRRAPDERVEPYRRRMHAPAGQALRDELAAWAMVAEPDLSMARPEMPEGIVDRDADVWEPLLAIADMAGGEWPRLARVSAVTLVTLAKAGTPSLGIRLLMDLRTVFTGSENMTTAAIIEALVAMDESPWGELNGKPLDARGLARRLKKYDIEPKTVRVSDLAGFSSKTAKGYARADMHDAWVRYLTPKEDLGSSANESVTTVTSETDYCARCSNVGCEWCDE